MPSGVYKGNKGKILSEKVRQKISIGHLGIKHFGHKQSKETIEKRVAQFRGRKSHFYKDGRSKNKKYINWQKNKRNRVIKRLKIDSLSHTYGEWETIKKQYGYICPRCHKSEPEIKLTEDHIIPLSRGGSDLIENIQPLCLSCNIRKHTNIIKY
jgi:5-methylcytosine-specific restriction endonuclease McrA